MEKTILIGGKAGQGVAQTSAILGKLFARAGFYVFVYRDYQSLIRGGHNFNVIVVGNEPVFSHRENYDLIVALDKKTIFLHQKNLKKGGKIIADKEVFPNSFVEFSLQKELSKIKAPLIFGNDLILGILAKIFGIPFWLLEKILKEFFGKNPLLKKSAQIGYRLAKDKKIFLKEPKNSSPKYFLSGSEGVALGAIAGGLDIYFAYPMTPATPVLHILAQKQKEYQISVFQPEDEISALNLALGASFGGATSMVGTSGGGFALMAEGLSLQGMAELPLVVYLAQRTAPSTGVPTYTAQGDLKFALNVGHGEFPKIVIAPGDSKEAFLRTVEAFYLTLKYKTLVILLSDKHLAESYFSFDQFEKPKVEPKRFILKKLPKNYQSYKITKTGVSPRAVPGQGKIVRATSYEHDEKGFTREEKEWIVKMQNKRLRKMEYIQKEVEKKLAPFSIYGQGENLLISWGSTKGAILDALKNLKNFRFLQISYLAPFPKKIKKEIQKSKKVYLIENNATSLLGELLREKTGIFIKNKILKYDGRPFYPQEILKKL